MNNTVLLVERVRLTCDPQSKNQVAIKLGAEQSLVRRWYRQKGYPNGVHAIEISKVLRMDIGSVLSYIAEDKAKTKSARELVARHLPRLLPTLGLALALAVGTIPNGYMDAQASAQSGITKSTDLYIIRSIRRGKAWMIAQVKRFFAGLLSPAEWSGRPALT